MFSTNTILNTKVSPDITLALRRDRIVVDPKLVATVAVDIEALTDVQLNLLATSIDPSGSGQLNEVIYNEDEVIRNDTRPLRAWPLTADGILEALGRCSSGC
jgi:hypothetical protein